MLKIDQSAFIHEFFKSENMINCNSINILMKAGYFINMQKPRDYKKAEIKPYQQLISKLIYLLYGTRPNMFFVVK